MRRKPKVLNTTLNSSRDESFIENRGLKVPKIDLASVVQEELEKKFEQTDRSINQMQLTSEIHFLTNALSTESAKLTELKSQLHSTRLQNETLH